LIQEAVVKIQWVSLIRGAIYKIGKKNLSLSTNISLYVEKIQDRYIVMTKR